MKKCDYCGRLTKVLMFSVDTNTYFCTLNYGCAEEQEKHEEQMFEGRD